MGTRVNGRDELPIPDKMKLDARISPQRQSLGFGTMILILWLTVVKVIRGDGGWSHFEHAAPGV